MQLTTCLDRITISKETDNYDIREIRVITVVQLQVYCRIRPYDGDEKCIGMVDDTTVQVSSSDVSNVIHICRSNV